MTTFLNRVLDNRGVWRRRSRSVADNEPYADKLETCVEWDIYGGQGRPFAQGCPACANLLTEIIVKQV